MDNITMDLKDEDAEVGYGLAVRSLCIIFGLAFLAFLLEEGLALLINWNQSDHQVDLTREKWKATQPWARKIGTGPHDIPENAASRNQDGPQFKSYEGVIGMTGRDISSCQETLFQAFYNPYSSGSPEFLMAAHVHCLLYTSPSPRDS